MTSFYSWLVKSSRGCHLPDHLGTKGVFYSKIKKGADAWRQVLSVCEDGEEVDLVALDVPISWPVKRRGFSATQLCWKKSCHGMIVVPTIAITGKTRLFELLIYFKFQGRRFDCFVIRLSRAYLGKIWTLSTLEELLQLEVDHRRRCYASPRFALWVEV
jgi:hypothetical protein